MDWLVASSYRDEVMYVWAADLNLEDIFAKGDSLAALTHSDAHGFIGLLESACVNETF